jgi:hypothetical protein
VFVHHVRIARDKDLDAELAAWLAESRREYGLRQWLRK